MQTLKRLAGMWLAGLKGTPVTTADGHRHTVTPTAPGVPATTTHKEA